MSRPRPALTRAVDVLHQVLRDQTDDLQADAAIRRQVSTARRLGVIGLAGGVGCSQLASRLAVLIARRRGARVLGVDAAAAETFTRLTQAVAGPEPEPSREPAVAGRILHPAVSVNRVSQVTAAMLLGAAGLRVLRPDTLAGASVRPQDWRSAVAPVARYFDVILTDWGRRLPGIDFEPALGASHAVVLACRADRAAIETAMAVAAAVNAETPCLVCAVDVDDAGSLAARMAARFGTVPVCYLPFMEIPVQTVPQPAVRRVIIDIAARLMTLAEPARQEGPARALLSDAVSGGGR